METWKAEDLLKIQFRIRDFYVISYEMNIQPHEEGLHDFNDLKFNANPDIYFQFEEEKAFLNLLAQAVIEKEGKSTVLSEIITRTHFDLKGVISNTSPEGTQIKIPNETFATLTSVAIANTRGAWSLVSSGKFIMPIIDLSNFNIQGFTHTNEIIRPASAPTEPFSQS